MSSPARSSPARSSPVGDSPTISARALLLVLGGVLSVLLSVFSMWELSLRGPGAGPVRTLAATDPGAPTAGPGPDAADPRAQVVGRYDPKGLAVARGDHLGELIVTWRMPIRPDVVATVIFEGAGAVKARAIVSYDSSPRAFPQVTLRGLPSRRKFCLTAAHLVSLDQKVTSAVSHPVCAAPR